MRDGAGWSHEPEAIHQVLLEAQRAGEELAEALGELGPQVTAVAEGSARSVPVTEALTGFFESRVARRQEIIDRVAGGITGAGEALQAYVHGDEEMAAQVQAQARRALGA